MTRDDNAHVVPDEAEDDEGTAAHDLTTMCWCQPKVEVDPADLESFVVIHRRFMDGHVAEVGA